MSDNAPNASSPSAVRSSDDFVALYSQIRRIAQHQMAQETPGHTLSATGLANEVWIKLSAQHDTSLPQSREHLLALCVTFMRRILVDHARSKLADKRGSAHALHLTQSALEAVAIPSDAETVAVHDTLLAFEAIDPVASKVVEMRFFGGLSLDEIALATGRSAASVKRDWTFARAWLHEQLATMG